jgi:mannose-6-phosphate isomerase-like protein (cupin superfamily)
MGVVSPDNMEPWSPLPGWSGRVFHSAAMTFAQWEIAADAAELHEHRHEPEEVWNVIDGELVIVLDGRELRLGAGEAAIVPPNAPHAAKPVGPCRALVVDHPARRRL